MQGKAKTYKCGSLCKVECNPPAKGGPSLASVMPMKGNTGPAKGAKALPNRMPSPKSGGGGKTEQPQ